MSYISVMFKTELRTVPECERLSEYETEPLVDLEFQPKNWDCGTLVVTGVRGSAGGSWSE